MLNIHDIAGGVGGSDDTAKRWLQVLEKSEVIFYLRPYSNNRILAETAKKRRNHTPALFSCPAAGRKEKRMGKLFFEQILNGAAENFGDTV